MNFVRRIQVTEVKLLNIFERCCGLGRIKNESTWKKLILTQKSFNILLGGKMVNLVELNGPKFPRTCALLHNTGT